MAFLDSDQSLQIIIKAKDEASKVFESLEKKVKKTGEGLKSAGKSMTASLTLPLAALGTASVVAAGNFEKSLGDLSTLVGEGTESMATFEKGIKDVMKTVPKSGDELGASAYSIVSAGISDASEALNVLEQSGRLAVAGLATTEQATDLLTTALNAFGKDASEAEAVADILFKTVKAGKTTVADMTQAFGKMAGNASAAGITLEEVQAATAALTTVTGKTAESQNALAQVFLELTIAEGKLDKALQEAGGSLQQLNSAISEEGLVDGMETMRDQLGLTNTEFKNMFSSAEGGTAVFQLLTSANKAAKDTLTDLELGANAIDAAFEAQKKTFNAVWQEMKNNLNIAMIELGTAIMPTLKEVMEKVADAAGRLAEWFGNLSPQMQQTVLIGAALVAALGPLIFILGQLVLIAPAVGAAFTIMTGPIGIVIAIIAALIAIGVNLVKNWDTIKWAAGGTWDWIKDKITAVVEAIKIIFTAYMNFWKEAWNSILEVAKDALALIVGLIDMFLSWLLPNWKENLGTMIEAWQASWNAFMEVAIFVMNLIKEFLILTLDLLKGNFGKFLIGIQKHWETVWTAIADFFMNIWESLKAPFNAVIDYFMEKIQKVIDMYNKVRSMVSNVGSGVSSFVGGAIDRGSSLLGFEHGGTVPGPLGQAVPILAHGQETIIPAGKKTGGGATFNVVINNPQFTNEDDERRIRHMLDDYFRPLLVNYKID